MKKWVLPAVTGVATAALAVGATAMVYENSSENTSCVQALALADVLLMKTGEALDLSAQGTSAYLDFDVVGIERSTQGIEDLTDEITEISPQYQELKQSCM